MKKNIPQAILVGGRILDAWLPRKIQFEKIPGLSVGLTHRGKLIYENGFGLADVAQKKPVVPETAYRIASISKIFTAVAVLQLAEQGKINLDDPAEKYLPWFKVKNSKGDSKHITVRQLLSHTAGVFRDGITAHWTNDKFPTLAELKKSVSDKTIVFENLTRFKYSNFGYALLGEIIHQVSGVSYGEYVTKNIIERLGLKNTFPDFAEGISGGLARGYAQALPDKKERIISKSIATHAYASATGFISNVFDLAKCLSIISLHSKDKHYLLNRESKKEMVREYVQTDADGKEHYGLGLEICRIVGQKIVGHGGGFFGYTANIALDTANDIGVIILSNATSDSIETLSNSIFEIIYGLLELETESDVKKKNFQAEKYEGTYQARQMEHLIVGLKNGLVAFDPQSDSPWQSQIYLTPIREDVFLMDSVSGYGFAGEESRFIFRKGRKKASRMFWGPISSERK